jgi:hypothetical protein
MGFVGRLAANSFERVHEERDGPMGRSHRDTIEIRVINDRGQWTADLRADEWPRDQRLDFPLFGEGTALPL